MACLGINMPFESSKPEGLGLPFQIEVSETGRIPSCHDVSCYVRGACGEEVVLGPRDGADAVAFRGEGAGIDTVCPMRGSLN